MPKSPSQFSVITTAILIGSLWLATRPYQGIFHDSRFYTGEALHSLFPSRFDKDLYFQFGSQGKFTVFSYLYGPLIDWLGLARGNLTLTIFAQLIWISGLWYLAQTIFRNWRLSVAAVAAAIILPSGSWLRYGEAFVTPRSFAEALTFWALASQMKGNPVQAIMLLGLSAAIHPLNTLPGLAICFFNEARKRPGLWFAILGLLGAALALAFANVDPFSRILIRFDPVWFQLTRVREDFCFILSWGADRWLPTIGTILLALFELTLALPHERRLLAPIFALGAGGIVLNFVGGDLLHNVLLLDIQTWRFMWISSLFANLFAIPILLRLFHNQSFSQMARWLVGLSLLALSITAFFSIAIIGTVVMLSAAIMLASWERLVGSPSPKFVQISAALMSSVGLVIVLIGLNAARGTSNFGPTQFLYPIQGMMLCLVIIPLIACTLLHFAHDKIPSPGTTAVFIATIAVAVGAGWQWDQRSHWNRFIGGSSPPAELTKLLPGDAPIYWEGDVTVPWFLLRRASYFTCDQGTGTLFSRATATAYAARYKTFASLQTLDFRQFTFCPMLDPRRDKPINRADLSVVCRAEKGLGALVLMDRVSDAPYRLWVSPVRYTALEQHDRGPRVLVSTNHFYVYFCSQLL